MKDFIPKGTGNSRLMKSSIPTGTTWEEALAMLRAGTFPFDLNGINAVGVAQMGDALNKANLLPDAVAALFGLGSDAVPSDVLEKLAGAAFNTAGKVTDVNGNPIGNKVETGSYVGTGTSGQGSKNSLTLSDVPKALFVFLYRSGQSEWYFMVLTPTYGMTYRNDGASFVVTPEISGNTINWYYNQTYSPYQQMNGQSEIYIYISLF